MPGSRSAWTLAIVSIALFMVTLDNLVVTTALPSIRADLGASIEALEWTVNGYTLAFAVLLLTGAAMGDRFGRRRMFLIGLGVFTAASAAAALAPDTGSLIAARAVQGAGAAIIAPLSLTLLSEAFPGERRGMALGVWSGVSGLGVALGPLVGGAVIEGLSWQWIFWLNVPIGIALLPLAARGLQESFGPARRLDLPGLALGSAGLLGVVYGIVRGNAAGWGSTEIVATLIAGVALLAAFVAWERRATEPLLPLRFFRSRRGARYGEDPVAVRERRRVIALTPGGRLLDDALVEELAAEPELTLLCGRYEGFDERIVEHFCSDTVSIGRYVLAGGELAAMVVCDAVLRRLPGALGHASSAHEESFSAALDGRAGVPALHASGRLARLDGARRAAQRPPRAHPRVARRAVALARRAIRRGFAILMRRRRTGPSRAAFSSL